MRDFFKIIAIYIVRFFMRLLQYIVPVKKNQIVFISNSGEQYSCNPKYISEYICKKYADKFEIVWLFKEPEKYSILETQKIKISKFNSFNRLKYGLTAKVIIINSGGLFYWIPLRQNQLHINTWHGGGYYKLAGSSEKNQNTFYKKCIALSSENTSYFLSTNKCFTDNEIRNDFYYDGEVLNIGFPRNDIFFHGDRQQIRNKVFEYFKIKKGSKLILYAPTFRSNDKYKFTSPNFRQLKQVAAESFGGEWTVFIRMHHNSNFSIEDQDTIDANYEPNSPDMQELLMACDILISDYSSCIWDYSFTYRPCFLFTPDLDEYTENRGFGIDIYKWGFPVCKTEQELYDAIKGFNEEKFCKAMKRHHENLGSFENGKACETMGNLIYDFCYNET